MATITSVLALKGLQQILYQCCKGISGNLIENTNLLSFDKNADSNVIKVTIKCNILLACPAVVCVVRTSHTIIYSNCQRL